MRIEEVLSDLSREAPDRPALGAAGRVALTFGALGAQRRYVRECLTGWGFGPGDIVAAMIPQRPEMAVALLTFPGTVTFAPLGSRTDAVLAAELLTRLGASAIVLPTATDHPVADAAARLGLARIDLVPEPERAAGAFRLRLHNAASADIPRQSDAPYAYVIATSGTTGRRKLVPFRHERLLAYAGCLRQRLRLTGDDVALHVMPLHHGHGINLALMVQVLNGGMVHVCSDRDVGEFLEAFERLRPTWFTAGFTFYRELLRSAAEGGAPPNARLRFARCGSGMLEPEEIAAFERTFRAPLLMGLMSQETLAVAHEPLERTVFRDGMVGLPLGNEVAVMNGAGAPLPAGAPGEICVRGPMVFDGYFDDPALTAQSFYGDWYRTGDLGRFDADGYLSIIGRIKEIISRGGEKISPVEVDAGLRHAPGVREAAAFGIPHPTLGEELGIAVVREPGATVSEDEIVARILSGVTAWRPRVFLRVPAPHRYWQAAAPKARGAVSWGGPRVSQGAACAGDALRACPVRSLERRARRGGARRRR